MRNRVLKVVSQIMNIPVEQINNDSSPETIENWDSLQHLSLILALEEEFNITFSDQEIIEMLSIKIIIKTLKKKKDLLIN